jgi:hypothetical protein
VDEGGIKLSAPEKVFDVGEIQFDINRMAVIALAGAWRAF